MIKQAIGVILPLASLLLLGCATTGKLSEPSAIRLTVVPYGDSFQCRPLNSSWYVTLPSINYELVNDEGFGGPNSVTFRHNKKKMSVGISADSARNVKSASEFRDLALPTRTFIADARSIQKYERDSVAFAEFNVNPRTGYAGRFVRAYYLAGQLVFEVGAYISDFDEARDRPYIDRLYRSVQVKSRNPGGR